MGELSKLINIGEEIERQLEEVGIKTYDELKTAGSKEAWLKIYETDKSACINRLMAIEGAIQGIKKTLLDEKVKADLKVFVKTIKNDRI